MKDQIAKHYFEAHITVEAREEELWDSFAVGARMRQWRASRFSEDEVDDMSGKWFLSYRGQSLNETKREVYATLGALRAANFEPIRWKIEDTVLDSKHGDVEADLYP